MIATLTEAGEDRSSLARLVFTLRAERDQLAARLAHSQQRNDELIRLCVALNRLHTACGGAEVRAALSEVVINLLGCEEFGVYRTDPDGGLRLLVGMGIEGTGWDRIPAGAGVVAAVAASGTPWLEAERGGLGHGGPARPVACIALRSGDSVLGVLALYRLLPHKETLDAFDRELLETLSPTMGAAIRAAELHDAAVAR